MAKRKADKQNGVIDSSELLEQWQGTVKELRIKHRDDLTEKQIELTQLILKKDSKIIFIKGPAGSAKSYTTVFGCLKLLNQKKCDEIIYVRSVVESASRSLGYLPGDAGEKLGPFLAPLFDKLNELLPKDDINYILQEGLIRGLPVNHLRGLSFDNKAIIIDESQNLETKELITALTRIGKNSKCFILADADQSDIGSKSGFLPIMNLFGDEESENFGIYNFQFTEEDIVRSELVKFLVSRFNEIIL